MSKIWHKKLSCSFADIFRLVAELFPLFESLTIGLCACGYYCNLCILWNQLQYKFSWHLQKGGNNNKTIFLLSRHGCTPKIIRLCKTATGKKIILLGSAKADADLSPCWEDDHTPPAHVSTTPEGKLSHITLVHLIPGAVDMQTSPGLLYRGLALTTPLPVLWLLSKPNLEEW